MKLFIKLMIFLTFASNAAAESHSKDILRCTTNLLGAPVYILQMIDPTDNPVYYQLVKSLNNPFYGPYAEVLDHGDVVLYGDVVIVTENQGRSGYAHLYHNGDVTVIDIDLFQNNEMNTGGPKTDYKCENMLP